MAEKGVICYKATDGCDVKLSKNIVLSYIVAGNQPVDDREIYSFMAKCQARGLNPLAGDAYMTAFRNNRTGRVEASVIVSKDYFVRTATTQEGFDGLRAGVILTKEDTGELIYREGSLVTPSETLIGGWAEVFDKNRKYPSRAEVSLEEYNQNRSLWLFKPATMIRKVALVQALREAYPAAYGGIYDADEMPQEKVAQAPTPAPQPVEPVIEEPTPEQHEEVQPIEQQQQEAEVVEEPEEIIF